MRGIKLLWGTRDGDYEPHVRRVFADSAVRLRRLGRVHEGQRRFGARINARMGLNTWAAFTGTDADAIVAGDVAMRDSEVTGVLKALRSNGLEVVAIHHHMTGVAAGGDLPALFRTGSSRETRTGRSRGGRSDWQEIARVLRGFF